MESACSICSRKPAQVCKCSGTAFCDKHLAKHLKSEGQHSVAAPEEVKVEIEGRSLSLREKRSPTGERHRRSNSIREHKKSRRTNSEGAQSAVEKKTLTKGDYMAILQGELAKVAKFRDSITDAIASTAERLISHIVGESKALTSDIARICVELETPLKEALQVLAALPENEQIIPKTNRVLARLYDARDEPGYEMLRLRADIHEIALDFHTVAEYSAEWAPVGAMVQLQQYYGKFKAEMHPSVQALFDTVFAEQHYTVDSIVLSKCSLSEHGNAAHLGQVLKYFLQVKELKLGGNDLDADSCRSLFPEIRQLRNITKLHLQKNDLKASGGRELALVLADLQMLRDLDLSSNSLGAEGMRHVATELRRLPKLKILHLQDNSLGSESAKILASALKQIKSLKSLHLEGNNFSSEEIRMLNNSNASGCKIFFNKSPCKKLIMDLCFYSCVDLFH